MARPRAAPAGSLKRPNTTTAMIAWVPTTPPRLPTPAISPAITDHRHSTIRCTQATEPLTEPTKVEAAITRASTVIRANGGRPPPVRQAMPTSMAPAAIVTAATGCPSARAPPSTATTGMAASSPA